MNKAIKTIFLSAVAASGATLLVAVVVMAGSLTPPGSPDATMYTISDIYDKLTDNAGASATEGNHDFAPASNPAGTMYTLTQIYNAVPTLDASQILNTYTVMGVTGTATPAPAETEWQTDPSLDLCWDSSFCSAGSGLLDPLGNGSVLIGAIEYCQYLNSNGTTLNCSGGSCTPVNYWHLPNEAELMIALSNSWISGGSGEPGGFRDGDVYWSSLGNGANVAWGAYGNSNGRVGTYNDFKGYQYAVRCAR